VKGFLFGRMLPLALMFLLFWSIVTQDQEKGSVILVGAFGERPLGMPPALFASLLFTALFAPLVWVVPHALRLSQHRYDREGMAGGGGFAGLFFLLAVGRKYPELRRSQAVCAFGLIYVMAVAAAWIIYTNYRGV